MTLELVRAAGFGHLVVAGPDGIEASPVPFVVDDSLASVRAHVARPNPIWRLAPTDALLIVPVTDAYISPGWYPSKAAHGKVVPTWNYEVVQVHGRLEAHDDDEWLDRQIRDLTDANEAELESPWSVDDAPADFVTNMRRGIVGIELTTTRIDTKRKLGQNRGSDEVDGAIAGLRSRSDARSRDVAAAMQRVR